MRSVAAGMGADVSEMESPISFLYDDQDSTPSNNTREYTPIEAIDPQKGGEVKPVYGEEELHKLPINLGYSIINSEEQLYAIL